MNANAGENGDGPETVLQFGAGKFLRAFVDLFIEQANRQPQTAFGRVVVVQSTGRERAEAINRAGGRYHVAVRGYREGRVVDEVEPVHAVSRALHAGTQWPDVLAVARSPDLRWIVSNTTEAGFALDDADVENSADAPPRAFPAKLLAVLLARFAVGGTPPRILPCELIEQNAARLRGLVLEQAARWDVPDAARAWVADACRWTESLVDRIVPDPPRDHPRLETDPLLLAAEPFALWAVGTMEPFELTHPAVVGVADLRPYYLRKVRILNGAHTALVAYARPRGLKTVRECVEHPGVGPWLERVLREEIVPVLEGRVTDPAGFARDTLERFRNPFLEHALSDIALNHDAKVNVRLRPTIAEYRARFGHPPPLLTAAVG